MSYQQRAQHVKKMERVLEYETRMGRKFKLTEAEKNQMMGVDGKGPSGDDDDDDDDDGNDEDLLVNTSEIPLSKPRVHNTKLKANPNPSPKSKSRPPRHAGVFIKAPDSASLSGPMPT
jgi:hypothetical protein